MPEAQKKTETPTADAAPPPPWVLDLLRALKPQGPLEQAGLMPEHIARIKELPAPQKFRDIPWRSEETGATGVAHVVESKGFPNGRVTGISGYTHPPAAYLHESDGGKVPDGFGIWQGQQRSVLEGQEPQLGDVNQAFKQWRYEVFWQADLRAYVRKEMRAGCCHEEGLGLKTPWQESKVGAIAES